MIGPLFTFLVLGGHSEVIATSAWVTAPDGGPARLGLVRRGATLTAQGCGDGGTWADVEGGRIRCAALTPTDAGAAAAPDPPLRWGSVRATGTTVRARPSHDGRALAVLEPPHAVALLEDPALDAGWFRHPEGGFVAASEVRLARPSTFVGEREPRLPLAFVVAPTASLARYARTEVRTVAAHEVVTADGALPRASVRLAFARPRPPDVPADARWVHVDVGEQVLTAYEGDTPVFATLVSTGLDRAEHRTRLGLFQVWLKSLHDRMHGERYFLEEVPRILFFARGQGLHGTFWHDRFGTPQSHGCVNLSLADAQWLFDWAPPALPQGWHTVMPIPAGRDALWVQVERAPVPRYFGPAGSAGPAGNGLPSLSMPY